MRGDVAMRGQEDDGVGSARGLFGERLDVKVTCSGVEDGEILFVVVEPARDPL